MRQFQLDLLESGPRVAMWLWWATQVHRDPWGNGTEVFLAAEAEKQKKAMTIAAHHQRLSGRIIE